MTRSARLWVHVCTAIRVSGQHHIRSGTLHVIDVCRSVGTLGPLLPRRTLRSSIVQSSVPTDRLCNGRPRVLPNGTNAIKTPFHFANFNLIYISGCSIKLFYPQNVSWIHCSPGTGRSKTACEPSAFSICRIEASPLEYSLDSAHWND